MLKLDRHVIEDRIRALPGWKATGAAGETRLEREFAFDDFIGALAFTVKVGMAAEKADHHPLIETGWGKVKVSWWSHSLGGVGERDFEMAGKTSALYDA